MGNELGELLLDLLMKINRVPTGIPGKININYQNRGILLIGQLNVLAFPQSLGVHPVHSGCPSTVFGGQIRAGEITPPTAVQDFTAQMGKQGLAVEATGRGIIQTAVEIGGLVVPDVVLLTRLIAMLSPVIDVPV